MKNTNKKLSDLLINSLKKVIKSDSVVLLDVPNYYNPGDQLIWEGENEIIKKLNKKVSYVSSLHFFNPKMVGKNDTILMQGGGNFGDLYEKHINFRKKIVSQFPKHEIIILPVTVHFSEESKLKEAGKYFSKHKNLTICARDKVSYDLLKKFFSNDILMLPDTAFAIEYFHKNKSKNSSPKILFMSRTDKENSKEFNDDEFSFLGKHNVSDWPTYNNLYVALFFHLFFLYINRAILMIFNLFGTHWDKKYDIYGLLKFHSKEDQINTGIDFLSKYDFIITTRLHGHIAACLLGIPNILLDNSYGKNKNFFVTWMDKNNEHYYYAENISQIQKIFQLHI